MSQNLQILPIDIAHAAMGVSAPDTQYKHYGLFDDGLEGSHNLLQAQIEFSGLIADSIIQSTKVGECVLLVGESLPAVGVKLKRASREFVCVVSITELETGQWSSFSAIVLEGSFHYLDQLPLLRWVKQSLLDGGALILFGEFLADDSTIEPAAIPNLSSLKQLSKRLGFELVLETDCTGSAIKSLESLRDKSTQVTFLPDRDSLVAAINTINSEFISGRRCFSMLQFSFLPQQITDFPKAEFLSNGEFSGNELSKLFESSFGHTFDEELWRWKYVLGKGKSIAAKEYGEGEIVSHYGGAPRNIYFFGEPNKAIQVCDVMVAPSLRKFYGKSSLFFKSAATFLEREIGNTVGHLLGFGFPNQKAMNIAIRLGLYEKTDDFVELTFATVDEIDLPATHLVDIDSDDNQHRESVDRLWQEMRDECTDYIVGVRDWSYFNYRYFQHPTGIRGGYRRVFLMDSQSNKLLAALVLKEHAGGTLLMELICKPSEVALRLRQLLSSCLNSQISGPLKFWITKAWIPRLALAGVVENNLGIEIPCNSWNPGPSAESLYGKWWLTAGDMDFL